MLYHHGSDREASPIAISGRTSYLRVRLEFLRYPQLIPRFFNTDGFEPPRRLTAASLWPWVGHPVSGLPPTTSRPFRLAFAPAPDLKALSLAANGNSPAHSSIGTLSARPVGMGLELLVGIRFQVLFHSPCGVLFTFPSRYSPLSVALGL